MIPRRKKKAVTTQIDHIIPARADKDPSELFAVLYDEYFDRVNKYLRYRMRNYWDADDLTALVFTKAYEACKKDGISGHFGPWIFRIAHNAHVDYLRKQGRVIPTEQHTIFEKPDDTWQPEERMMTHENVRQLQEMLDQLPEEYRDVIAMRYIADLKVAQIAELLGRTEGATKTLLYRAIRKLRDYYEQSEGRERDE